MLNQVVVRSRIYVLLCALAGVSPLVGVQGHAWDYPILMVYYFAEAAILMLIGLWKILACDLKATPDGHVEVLPGGGAKITTARFAETVQPMPKGGATFVFLTCSSIGAWFTFIHMHSALARHGGIGEPFQVIFHQWPLFSAGIVGLLVQHGYRFVSDFWLGPQRNYPPGYFVARAILRTYVGCILVFLVAWMAHVFGSHFALAMTILIVARTLVQTAFAICSKLGVFRQTGADGPPRIRPRT